MILGITTYNRKEILLKMVKSLKESINVDNCKIIVFDDNSTEFGKKFLAGLFPNASIIVNKQNKGADFNTYSMYKYFLEKTNDNILFNLDSDLLFDPNFINKGIVYIQKTDGILSLYNSYKHQSYGNVIVNGDNFLLKKTMSAAGVAFERKILEDIIQDVLPSRQFDWDWSKNLKY